MFWIETKPAEVVGGGATGVGGFWVVVGSTVTVVSKIKQDDNMLFSHRMARCSKRLKIISKTWLGGMYDGYWFG